MEREDAAILLDVRPDASKREVRAAFRRCVRTYHPDSGAKKVADFAKFSAARDLLLTPAPKVRESAVDGAAFVDLRKSARVPTTIEYGYDPDATASWAEDPEPFITRPGQSIGDQRFRNGRARLRPTTIASMFFAILFVVMIAVALL